MHEYWGVGRPVLTPGAPFAPAAAAMAPQQKKWRRDASGAARCACCLRDTSSDATLCAAASSSARQPFVLMRGQGQAGRSHASERKQGIGL